MKVAHFLIALFLVVAAAVPPVAHAVEVPDSLWVPSTAGEPRVEVEATGDIPNLHQVLFSRRCAPGVEFKTVSGGTATECALYGQSGAILQANTAGLIKIAGVDAPTRYADGGSASPNLLPDGAFIHYRCDGGFGCFAQIDPTAPKYRLNPSTQRFEWMFERPTVPRVSAGGVDLRLYPISTAVSKTGRYLVSVTSRRILWIDRATGDVRQVASTPEPGLGFSLDTPLSVSPSGRYVAVGANPWGNTLRVFDMRTCSPDPRPFEATCDSVDLDDLFNESKLGFYPGRVVRVSFYGESQLSFAARTSFLPGGSDTEFRQFLMTAEGAEPPADSAAFLGDSFTSGEGVQKFAGTSPSEEFVYLDGTDVYSEDSCETAAFENLEYRNCDPVNLCHVSSEAWPDKLAFTLGLAERSTFACSGARTYDLSHVAQYPQPAVAPPGFPGSEPQFASLARLDAPRRIFVQIGGNDAGFSDILAKCAGLLPDDCSADPNLRREFALRIQRTFYLVRTVLAALREDYERESQIYLVGYPQIVDPAPDRACGANVRLTSQERAFAGDLLGYLDQVGQSAAASSGVRFISLADSIADHQLCDPVPWVNGLTAGNDLWGTLNGLGIGNESYHPRREAHAAFADRVAAALVSPEAGNPKADVSVGAPALPAWAGGTATARDWAPVIDGTPAAPTMPRVHAEGLKPGSPVTGYFASEPVPFASAVADENGVLTFSPQPVTLLPPGLHTLHVLATAADGGQLHSRIPVLVPGGGGDVDVDGVPDLADGCPLVPAESAAEQEDGDGDGAVDGCDPTLLDGPSADPDGDSLTNEEEGIIGTDPNDPDSDADLHGDGADNCPSLANPGQEDADADGAGDACDLTPNGDDRDGDGVLDAVDNCGDLPNPDQEDSDGDGLGDTCDPTPEGEDSDGDGVVDTKDNCVTAPNPDQYDTDGDQVGDECDSTPGNTDECRVEGEGRLTDPGITFQLQVRPGRKGPTGEVEFRDRSTGLKFESTRIANLIVRGPRGARDADIRGRGKTHQGPVDFRLETSDGKPDLLEIVLSGSVSYAHEGQIRRGDVKLRCGGKQSALGVEGAWWRRAAV